jgi:hypothetical protein
MAETTGLVNQASERAKRPPQHGKQLEMPENLIRIWQKLMWLSIRVFALICKLSAA